MNNVILIYGNEDYFIEKKIREIFEHNHFLSDSINKYNMEETSIEQVIEDATTYNMFSEEKIIICDNCIFLTGTTKKSIDYNVEELIRYLNNSNPMTTIVFIVHSDKLDERKKIVKLLKEKALTFICNKLDDRELNNYINSHLKKNGFSINNDAVQKIINYVGNNLYLIHSELDKLMVYKINDKKITLLDVEELVSRVFHTDIFELINVVLKKDYQKIFRVYNELLLVGEEPIKILVSLSNQFRLIYQTKILIKQGYSEKDIASKLSVHPYRIKLAREISISAEEALKYLNSLCDLDINIKTGKIDKTIGLELFLLKL